jgi:transposase
VTVAVPNGAKVWLASGHTDMRKGFDGLALLVQEMLKRDPHNGQLFVFRGRRGSLCSQARPLVNQSSQAGSAFDVASPLLRRHRREKDRKQQVEGI